MRLILSTAVDLLVRDRQRLQPVGPVPGRRPEHGHQRRLDLRRARARRDELGIDRPVPGASRRRRCCSGCCCSSWIPFARRAPPRPADDPRRRLACWPLAFFAVPTRVHERYLFPLFGLAAILLAFSWRWRIAYVVAAVATFLNMYVVLDGVLRTTRASPTGSGSATRSARRLGVTVIACSTPRCSSGASLQLRPAARRTLAAELEDGRERRRRRERGGRPGPAGTRCAGRRRGRGRGRRPQAPGATAAAARRVDAEPPARPGLVRPPVMDGASARSPGSGRGSTRRPSAPTARASPRGPAAASTASTCAPDRAGRRRDGPAHVPVAEPARMHFDEVYHARTAAEFLQDWRYGISHYIYEWTHPHLAKYAMAVGIVLFAGHDTQATSDLGVPVRDAAIEPRRPDASSDDRPRRRPRLGRDRLGADRLRPAHAQAGRVVDRGRRRRAVAFDSDRNKLYVGHRWRGAAGPRPGQPRRPGRGQPSTRSSSRSSSPRSTARSAAWRRSTTARTLAAILPGDTVVIVDPDTGTETGRRGRARCRRHGRRGQRPGDRRAAGPGRRPRGRRRRARLDPRRRRGLVRGPAGRHRAGDRRRRARAHGRRPREAPDGHRRREAARDLGGRRGPAGGRRHGRGHAAHRPAARPRPPSTSRGRRARPRAGARASRTAPSSTSPPRDASTGEPQVVVVAVTGEGAEKGPAIHGHAADAGPGHARRVRLGGRDGRGPRDEAGRDGIDGLRRRAARQERVRRPGRPVPADRLGARPQPGLPDGEPGPDPRVRRQRRDGVARRRRLRVRLAAARRVHGRGDRRAAVPARADPVPPPVDRRARRAVRAARRHVLRPEPDRDERRVRRRVHPGRVLRVRLAVDQARAATLGVLDADADDRRVPGPRAGVQVGGGLRDRRAGHPDPGPLRPGPAAPDLRDDRAHRRARLDGDGRARGQRGVRQPAVHADHDRPHAGDGRRDHLPPHRVVRRGDVVRGGRARGDRHPDRVRLDRAGQGRQDLRRRARSSSRRSRSRFAFVLVGILAYAAFQVAAPIRIRAHGEDAGAGRPAPPAAARVAAGNRLAAAGVGPRHPRRVDAGIPAGDPARGLRDHVHPVGVRRGPPDHQGLAARPHGPDPARPHRGDVPVPQRPDRAAPGELAVVGLAAEPQAGLVLPGQLRQLDRRLDLRRGQRDPVVDGHPGDGVRRRPGVPAALAAPRAGPDRLPVPVDLVGADRPGGVPVPLLHEPAVPVPGARLLHRRAVARAVEADVDGGARRRGVRAVRPDHPVAAPPARCAGSPTSRR